MVNHEELSLHSLKEDVMDAFMADYGIALSEEEVSVLMEELYIEQQAEFEGPIIYPEDY